MARSNPDRVTWIEWALIGGTVLILIVALAGCATRPPTVITPPLPKYSAATQA